MVNVENLVGEKTERRGHLSTRKKSFRRARPLCKGAQKAPACQKKPKRRP